MIHQKAVRTHWKGDSSKLLTVGISKASERQICLWDSKKLDKPLVSLDVDTESGYPLTFYDDDLGILFFAAKV